jgi:hypothetical protein
MPHSRPGPHPESIRVASRIAPDRQAALERAEAPESPTGRARWGRPTGSRRCAPTASGPAPPIVPRGTSRAPQRIRPPRPPPRHIPESHPRRPDRPGCHPGHTPSLPVNPELTGPPAARRCPARAGPPPGSPGICPGWPRDVPGRTRTARDIPEHPGQGRPCPGHPGQPGQSRARTEGSGQLRDVPGWARARRGDTGQGGASGYGPGLAGLGPGQGGRMAGKAGRRAGWHGWRAGRRLRLATLRRGRAIRIGASATGPGSARVAGRLSGLGWAELGAGPNRARMGRARRSVAIGRHSATRIRGIDSRVASGLK